MNGFVPEGQADSSQARSAWARRARLEAYATLLSGLARKVWKSFCKRFRLPAATWQRRKVA